jgi:hypothetical protein
MDSNDINFIISNSVQDVWKMKYIGFEEKNKINVKKIFILKKYKIKMLMGENTNRVIFKKIKDIYFINFFDYDKEMTIKKIIKQFYYSFNKNFIMNELKKYMNINERLKYYNAPCLGENKNFYFHNVDIDVGHDKKFIKQSYSNVPYFLVSDDKKTAQYKFSIYNSLIKNDFLKIDELKVNNPELFFKYNDLIYWLMNLNVNERMFLKESNKFNFK